MVRMMPGLLEDACLVVRGGVLEITTLRRSLETCKARMGFYGLSIWGENGLSFEEVCARARLGTSWSARAQSGSSGPAATSPIAPAAAHT